MNTAEHTWGEGDEVKERRWRRDETRWRRWDEGEEMRWRRWDEGEGEEMKERRWRWDEGDLTWASAISVRSKRRSLLRSSTKMVSALATFSLKQDSIMVLKTKRNQYLLNFTFSPYIDPCTLHDTAELYIINKSSTCWSVIVCYRVHVEFYCVTVYTSTDPSSVCL